MTSEPDGFALIEAVVSLAIVAAILGATFQTMSFAHRAMTAAEQRRVAMLEARSLTDQLGATLPLVPGTSQGQSGAMRWRIEIELVPTRQIQAPLLHAVVTVGDDRLLVLARLDSLRLAS